MTVRHNYSMMERREHTVACVTDSQLVFGCMKAQCIFSHVPLTLMIYDSPRQIFSIQTPQIGDHYICVKLHHSVVIPLYHINMNFWLLRHTTLPSDILETYFKAHTRVNFSKCVLY